MSTEDFGKLWTQLESEIFLHRQKTLVQACRANLVSQDQAPTSKKIREVKFVKKENEQLGLSITGGEDVGCPIIISDIGEHGVAAKTGEIVVGDAILSINGMKLKGLKHSEAAAVLSNANGEICLEVQFLIPDYHKINDQTENDTSKITEDEGVVSEKHVEIDHSERKQDSVELENVTNDEIKNSPLKIST